MSQLKLAVFDMEGTIFQNTFQGQQFPSIWKVLCNLCGPHAAAEDQDNTDRYYAGGYPGYSAWVLDTLQILKKYGLKRSPFETLVNQIDYYPGVAETFAALRGMGMTIAVISGGLKAQMDRVVIDHYLDHCFAAAEFHWNEDGTIRHWNMQPTDFDHKRSVLEILCRDLGVKADECVFVGDGRNDRAVAGYCGLSIGFNPHEELRKEVDVIIEQEKGAENLAAVLQPIRQFPNYSLNHFREYKIWRVTDITTQNPAATLSTSGQRDNFHRFLVSNGLTSKSSDSYCSYLNNLCRNISDSIENEVAGGNTYNYLERIARSTASESEFILMLERPLSGSHGRSSDLVSAAKQFHRYIKG